eukprot:TRINITY_DN48501_c0_g1_i1.p1 TRINITY_DN48501_c0_g1~~TRINITY_DN48501_c0_g1_i1.p1  ORF type:complete len:124 (+),score=37.88 TRINITY_DN48501_c0_g1_i1:37-372(+)
MSVLRYLPYTGKSLGPLLAIAVRGLNVDYVKDMQLEEYVDLESKPYDCMHVLEDMGMGRFSDWKDIMNTLGGKAGGEDAKSAELITLAEDLFKEFLTVRSTPYSNGPFQVL